MKITRYTMLEYIERMDELSKRKDREAVRKEASKIMRTMEIEMLAERKPDAKAYERFKRKPYTTSGGVAIGQKRPD